RRVRPAGGPRRMTFRGRLTVVAAVAVAVAVALASGAIFLVVRAELRSQVDASLRDLAGQARIHISAFTGEMSVTLPPSVYGGASGYAQVVAPNGALRFGGGRPIPVSARASAVAAGRSSAYFEDTTVDGIHLRVYTTQLQHDRALQVTRPLTSLRTNIEVLETGRELGTEDRRRLLADVRSELEELTVLVGDLVELGRGSEPVHAAEEVRLDRLVGAAVERAAARAPQVRF